MAAITWRNVSGPTGAAELNALAGASRQIGGAFDGLQNALVNYQKEEGRQFEQRKTENTNAFLNALHSQYRTPEELDAAIKSGAVNQLQQQFGSEVHADQIRGAADNLLASRRQQGLAGMQYNNQISADQAAPIKSRAQYLASIGDQAGAQGELQKLDPRYQGEAASAVLSTNKDHFGLTRLQNQEARDQESHDWAGEQHKSRLATDAASRAASHARTQLTRMEISDKVSDKQADDVGMALIRAHHEQVSSQKSEFDKLAKENPSLFPVKNGKFDITQVDAGRAAAMEPFLKERGLDLGIYTSGDTEAMQEARDRLIRGGASARAVTNFEKKAGLFSTAPAEAIGIDAAAKKAAEENQARQARLEAEAVGGPVFNKEQMADFVSKDLAKLIVNEDFDKSTVVKRVNRLVNNGGIDMDDGTGRKVFPNPTMIVNAINSANSSATKFDSADIDDVLDKAMKEAEANLRKLQKRKDAK